jgi:hypothetical protein
MERTLSKNEAKVILDLEWRGQATVTLAELRQALGASDREFGLRGKVVTTRSWRATDEPIWPDFR